MEYEGIRRRLLEMRMYVEKARDVIQDLDDAVNRVWACVPPAASSPPADQDETRKVWAVKHLGGQRRLRCIFSSREAAEASIGDAHDAYYITEYEVADG